MHDLAHVTDLHLVEPHHVLRRGAERQRLQCLNAGRVIDPADRKAKAVQALRTASRNARHVCVTGDLTEDGAPAQYEVLAEVLSDAALEPERVTLLPGNHDLYTRADGFERALAGPLRPFAQTSAAGRPFELGEDALLMPISTAFSQNFLRSAGRISEDDARRVDWLAFDARRAGKLALVALHHPPHGHRNRAWNWIDGMINPDRGIDLLARHGRLQMLHGHTHKRASVQFANGRPPQAHSGAAVVMRAEHVRYYQVTRDALLPVRVASEMLGVSVPAALTAAPA